MSTRILLFGALLTTLLVACGTSSKPTTGGEYNIDNPATADETTGEQPDMPQITFDEQDFNFGTVIQGEKVSHSFGYTNTGTANLVISNVKASCGCTVPKWTKEPVKPGGTGYVEIIFDSSNREGSQIKSANVFSNTSPNMHELHIRCEIVK